jgi:hypothetical protein
MKINHALILLFVLLSIEILAQPDSISNFDQLNINIDFFDKQELEKLKPNEIYVLRHIYFENQIFRTDTVYKAVLKKGKISEEFSMRLLAFSDSTHTKYNYNKRVLNSIESFQRDRNEDTIVVKKQFNQNGLIIKEEEFLSEYTRNKLYTYNQNNSVDIIEFPLRNLKYKHYYDSLGRLERMVELNSEAGKLDSIINKYQYDANGNIIKKSRKLSKTYSTTFETDCYSGFGTEYFTYDTLNRMTVVGNKKIFQDPPQKDKWGFLYSRIAYKEIKYLQNGILFEIYNSDNVLQESKLYYKYKFDQKQVESFENKTKVTYFLNNYSKLPKRIDISSNDLLIFEFEYLK